MELIENKILLSELKKMSEKMFGGLVKAVVDIEKEIMVVDAQLHADEEMFLLENTDSQQENLWGINMYPDKYGREDFIEFDSMINIRPAIGNKSRGVENAGIRKTIVKIVHKLVKE